MKKITFALFISVSAFADSAHEEAKVSMSAANFVIPGDYDRARSIMLEMAAGSYEKCAEEGSHRERYLKDVNYIKQTISKAGAQALGKSGNDAANLLVIKAYFESLVGRCERSPSSVASAVATVKQALEYNPKHRLAHSMISRMILTVSGKGAIEKIALKANGVSVAKLWKDFSGKLLSVPEEERSSTTQKAIVLMGGK